MIHMALYPGSTARVQPGDRVCAHCRWWLPIRRGHTDTDEQCPPESFMAGECRRVPPSPVGHDQNGWRKGHQWPVLGRADWCGEFEQRSAGEDGDG